MSLTCEICGRQFPTNTSLYVHKQTQHSQPKLLLMNHNHDDANKNHDEHDSGLKVIDEYKFDKKKRKRLNNDSKPKPKKTKNDVFEIIDEYNDQWRNDRPCYPCYAGGRHLRGAAYYQTYSF